MQGECPTHYAITLVPTSQLWITNIFYNKSSWNCLCPFEASRYVGVRVRTSNEFVELTNTFQDEEYYNTL